MRLNTRDKIDRAIRLIEEAKRELEAELRAPVEHEERAVSIRSGTQYGCLATALAALETV